MGATTWYHLDVERVLAVTEKAIQVLLPGGEVLWLPKSQMHEPEGYKQGDKKCTISITEWIAKAKNLPGFD